MTEEDFKKKLTPEQYKVLREKGTEAPFTGEYVDFKGKGMFNCAACGVPLFSSDTKFDSGTGWPSFSDIATKGNVILKDDDSQGMHRIEVECARCGSHLGHVFDDGPSDKGGKRYCINSCALNFEDKIIN
ncbi:MAG: peptide-methionine (R)-S-oxide reductase MsrB [bacterium]|nr:peptide-methionine (R)-S-oxide reductase MsrB [bacterium]